MKRILLATTMLAATAFAANAASTSFNGAYVGAQAGLVMSKTNANLTNPDAIHANTQAYGIPGHSKKSSRGLLFGMYFGYGHNMNGFYIGAEMSILGDTTKRTTAITLTEIANNDTLNISTKFKRGLVFGLAPRLGYVFGENLIYVKPGIEISRDKASAIATGTSAAGVAQGTVYYSGSQTNVAIAPAFGYERAFGKMIFRAEYTYVRGGKVTLVDNQTHVVTGTTSYKDNRFVIGAAYKF